MSPLVNATKVTLIFLSAAGYYATWYFLFNNGTTDHIAHNLKLQLLPGTKEPVRTVYIGVPAVDHQLTVLTLFFWGFVDGSNPSASLFAFYFATQIACGWGLLMVESLRHGNRWSLISFIGVWGVFVQNAAYAVIIPIWCIAHLSLSRTVSSKRLYDFLVRVPDLAGIAFAMVNVYILSTFLTSLPAPSVVSHDLKQWFMAFWQFFPIWISLAQWAVQYLLFGLEDESSGVSITDRVRKSSSSKVKWLRALYAGLLTAAGLGQAKTLTLMWTSWLLPGLFKDEFINVFNFSNVFLPATTSPYIQTPSIRTGSFLMLQYDYFIGSISMALWSTMLFVNTYRNGTIERSLALMIAGGFVMLALTGPLGYATALVWARDELLVAEAKAEADRKKVQ